MVASEGIGPALEDAEDAFLVGRAAEGDLRAFTVLLRRHNGTLRRYVERLTRNPADTDDVLQETATIAWQHLADVEDPAKVRSWLIQIATRQSLRHRRARPDEVELTEDLVAVAGPDVDVDRLDVRRELQVVIDALPRQQARCWILRELGGYRYGEIAQQLQIPESTVRGSLVQARRTILTAMGGHR
ncbi:RNA polymerase sigma factor [uncultured Amnibacterium sp.]|uniref:RNA polymerase sigma factor n=1 Tax=uncultured Amnibacterium sp. TaxID=1631851 RepID=UPI0035C9B9DA